MKPYGGTISVLAALLLVMTLAAFSAACVTVVPRSIATPVATPTPPAPSPTPPPTPTSTPAPTATPTATLQGLLDVRGPEDSAAVRADSVVVHGYAHAEAAVRINDKPVNLDQTGRFSQIIDLSPGVNAITVNATTPEGATETATLSVISLLLPPQPFFLIVTQPEDQSFVPHPTIPLVGRTTDGTVVTVNGVAVPVDISGVFSTTITLDTGPNLIEVQGTSTEGDQISALVAVTYRPQ